MKKPSLVSKKNKTSKASPITVVIFILFVIYMLGLFAPAIWALIVSFTDVNTFRQIYLQHYKLNFEEIKFTFENYKNVWPYIGINVSTDIGEVAYDIWGLFQNSLLYAVGCSLAYTICCSIVAYLAARFNFKFSKVIYAFIIVAMSLPIVGSMPSELKMLEALGIRGEFWSMWILRCNFLGIYFLIFYAQFKAIPMSYTEAAKIDGASNLRIMFRIILPQALNIIITVFILNFIQYWNEYQIPLAYIPDYPTVAYCILDMSSTARSGLDFVTPNILAALFILSLPIIAVFVAINKKIRVNVSMGGIKS